METTNAEKKENCYIWSRFNWTW